MVGHYWTLLDIIGQNWTFIPGFTEMVAKTAVYHFWSGLTGFGRFCIRFWSGLTGSVSGLIGFASGFVRFDRFCVRFCQV